MRTFRTDIMYVGVIGNIDNRETNLEITKNMILRAQKETGPYTGKVKILEKFDRANKLDISPVKVKIRLLDPEVKVVGGIFNMKLDTHALQEAYDRGILTTLNYAKIRAGGLPVLEQYSNTPEGIKKCYAEVEKMFKNNTKVVIERDAYDRRWRANVYAFKDRSKSKYDNTETLNRENNIIAHNMGMNDPSALTKLFSEA